MDQQYLETVKIQNEAKAKYLRELQIRFELELNTLADTTEQTGELMHAKHWDIENLMEYRAQAAGILEALTHIKLVISAELDKIEPIELSVDASRRGMSLLKKLLITHHMEVVGTSQQTAEAIAHMDVNNLTMRDLVYNLRSWGFTWSDEDDCWTRLNIVR